MSGTVNPNDVIYFNNSLLTRRAEWIYDVELARDINAQHDIIYLGDSLIANGNWNGANYGYGGDTTQLILQRLDIVINAHPSKVYIMVGVNDFFRGGSVEWINALYNGIINKLLQAGITVNILSTLKVNPSASNYTVLNSKIEALNSALSSRTDVTFIDLNSQLSDANGLKSEYTTDGIHLNSAGYAVAYTLI